jgi:phosphate ABC transporter permease protein PstC
MMRTKFKIAIAILITVLCLGGSFMPQYAMILGGRLYQPVSFKMVLAPFTFEGAVVYYPLLVRAAEALFLASLAASLALLIFKRTRLAAAFMSLGVASRLVSGLGIVNLPTMLKSLNLPDPYIATNAVPFYLNLIGLTLAVILLLWSKGGEDIAQAIFQGCAYISVASVVLITGYMLIAGLPAIVEIGPLKFLFGTIWKPTQASNPLFGILPMMLATVTATLGAVLIGVPTGLLTAIFLAEIAPVRVATLVRPAVELLAGIPSVIYGFFGLQLLVPLVQKTFNLPSGANLFSAIIILAIMILPTIVSTAETGLRAVPIAYKEASLAVGATHVTTIFKVLVPAARSSILSGVILGVGRAIGETMAVIMVAGNVPNLPGLFTSVRPLTVGIALEMSYASGLHQKSLFAIGLVLFAFIMLVNASFSWISKKGVQMNG